MAHEDSEPKNLLILGIGVGSLVAVVAVMFGLQNYTQVMEANERVTKVEQYVPPELQNYRAEMNRQLTTYAKLDPQGNRVRIPIDEAMKLFAQRGRAGFPAIKVDPSTIGGVPTVAPAPNGSAAPAASGSAAPAVSGSASAPSPAMSGSAAHGAPASPSSAHP